jgi:hypothetical protein
MIIVEELDYTEDTYDITVQDTKCFFANDVLVHNSEIILRPYQFCNLTEIIVRAEDTQEDLKRKARIATILGTFQSTLTHFPYLRKIWKDNTEQERLLGVSMTGILDNSLLNDPNDVGLPARLEEIKKLTVEVNAALADELGIPVSASITAVKPSGCTTAETHIRTTQGIMSMAQIFEHAGHNISDYKDRVGVWLDAENLPQVYDKNDELQDITKLYINGVMPVIEIEFEDGKKYKFTENHQLLTVDGWKRVDELSENDDIISF